MRFSKILPLLSVAMLLPACGTVISGATQEITLATPGAYNAECTLDNGNHYRMRTGETRKITRTYKPLEVDCYATGNRHIARTIGSGFNEWSLANVSNGVAPGGTYDAVAGGLFEYPDVITIDFVGVAERGFELPEYHNKDNPNPYEQAIEDYGPRTTRIPNDSTYLKRGAAKRDAAADSNPFNHTRGASSGASGSGVTPMPSASSPSSSTVQPSLSGSNAEELTRSMNPGVFGN